VDASGEADFTGIRDAINNASDGDTILVYSGVYYENVVVDKSVTLKGIDYPVVNARGGGSAVTLTADGITVEGFNVTNSGDLWNTAGIRVFSKNNNITGNNVYRNRYGIRLYNSSNNALTGNNASNNVFGIALSSSRNNAITDNTVSNKWHGIDLSSSSNNNSITSNKVSNNDDGIHLYDSSNNNAIKGNAIYNNCDGICIASSSGNNAITGNTFVNDGLFISSSYQNMVENNTVNGKPLTYLEDASDTKVADAGPVILVNCNNITVENQDLSNTSVGVALLKTEYSIISNNIMSNNSRKGIYLSSSSNNFIINNTDIFTDRVMAIKKAIVEELKEAIEKLIEEEAEEVGTEVGKGIERPKIPLNLTSTNTWNSTKEISYIYNGSTFTNYLGNYWSDYEEKYPDAEEIDTTGIWDTPYCIDRDKDNYPLMERRELYYTLIGYCCNRNFSHLLYGYKWYRGYFNNRGQVQKFCIYEYYNFYWLFCDCWTVTYTPNSSRVLSQLSYSNMSNTR